MTAAAAASAKAANGVDEDAKAAWEKTLAGLESAMAAATDVPWEIAERKMSLDLARKVSEFCTPFK